MVSSSAEFILSVAEGLMVSLLNHEPDAGACLPHARPLVLAVCDYT